MNKQQDAWTAAVHLLSRREHGEQELLDKLIVKGHDPVAAEAALYKCKDLHLQSDARYVENVCLARIRQGYGPVRIRQELLSKGIDKALVQEILESLQIDWLAQGLAVWKKKGSGKSQGLAALQKKQRFLMYRGFPAELVSQIARMDNFE